MGRGGFHRGTWRISCLINDGRFTPEVNVIKVLIRQIKKISHVAVGAKGVPLRGVVLDSTGEARAEVS
jgi:hypothetical protein